MYNKELLTLHYTAVNLKTKRLSLDHPKKERLLLAIDRSALGVRRIIATDKTIDTGLLKKLKSKIDYSLNILNKGSGRLHNDMTPWNEAANLDMWYLSIKKQYKKYAKETKISHIPIENFDLDKLDINIDTKEEVNVFDKPFLLDRSQILIPRNNIKIIKIPENNEFYLRVKQLSSSSDLLPIESDTITQNVYDLPQSIMYENEYIVKTDNPNVLQKRVDNIVNILIK